MYQPKDKLELRELIADEYINKIDIYGYWKDTVILIKGEAVKSYTLMFLQLFSLYEKDSV